MPTPFRSRIARADVALLGAVATLATLATRASAQPDPRPTLPAAALAKAVQEVEALDALRSSLARTFASGGVAATDSTFAQVCKPVKAQAMRVAQQQGWLVAQLAERHRNPDNAPDAEARRVLREMQRDPALVSVARATTYRGKAGTRYFRRITVETACLACHGAREARPAFVQQHYPADKAYGFVAGDLRGIYSVFIPDSARRE